MSTQTLEAPALPTAPDQYDAFRRGVPGVYKDVPGEVYHKLAAVSSSQLKRIHTHTPLHAKAVIDNPDLMTSDEMDIGGGAHAILLTPRQFEEDYAFAGQCEAMVKSSGLPCENSGVKRVAGQWLCGTHSKGRTCDLAGNGITVLTTDNYRRVKGIHDAVWNNREARKILEVATDFELSVLWTDPETGLLNKARLDILCATIGVMPDLKTCRSIKLFTEHAWKLAYHIQLAHYRRTAIVSGVTVDIPAIIAVENEEPFDVAVFRPTDRFMELGVRDMDKAMHTIAECHRSGMWPGFANGTQYLDAPDWAK
jgi:hypothetical protein